MNDWPKVAIIVQNWKGLADTCECTEAARHITYPNHETIIVEGIRPPIDRTRSALTENLEADVFQNLPVARDSYVGLLSTIAGAALHPRTETPTIRGGSFLDTQILIDGINYSDPLTNSALQRFDFYAIDEIQVLTGGLDADYGQALGGVVNIVTRSGGNEHKSGGRVTVSPRPFRDRRQRSPS